MEVKGTKEWWKQFHQDLDTAIATMINEKSEGRKIFLPNEHFITELMEFSNKKRCV